jgi:tRNA threonylcarbamoyladenosine biosynthesis protein TsaB
MGEAADFNLAIETSSRHGSVTLGRADVMLATVELPEQRRHAVELMPAIDRLCRDHGAGPRAIGEIYVSVGPGSFTGLRVGVTTAKILGRVTGAKLVAVPTLAVVAANAPADMPRVAVMLNAKGGRCFTGVFEEARPVGEPSLMTPAELANMYRGPLIGDHLPPFDWPEDVQLLDSSLAVPRSAVVWSIGRKLAVEGRFTPALEFVPLYVRLPEAEELWQARNQQAASHESLTPVNETQTRTSTA